MFTVAVVTGTRAEYGLLRPVLQKMQESRAVQPRLVVTGAHLAPEFGRTVSEIEADGLPIAARLDFLARTQDAPGGRAGTAVRTSCALSMFTEYFMQNPPDAVLLLGDRYEILAAAEAAALLGIPVAHISGGDVTSGADDDWYRHCVTKMAKLHFPSCEEYRRRIIRMGEAPAQVFNVGGLGDENIRSMRLLERHELLEQLGIAWQGPCCLVTFHPETATGTPPEAQGRALLAAMEEFPALFFLCTKANADAGGSVLNRMLEEFCAGRPNAALFSSLGTLRYLSAMKHASLVLGNSSSGLAEGPSLGVPVVNVGHRQDGRVRCANIIDCALRPDAIAKAVRTALQPAFSAQARGVKSPYNGGNTSGRIVAALESQLQSGALEGAKIFYDGEVTGCTF